jgi:hypothetical protein
MKHLAPILLLAVICVSCHDKKGAGSNSGVVDSRIVAEHTIVMPSNIHYTIQDSSLITTCVWDVDQIPVAGAHLPLTVSAGELHGSLMTNADGCIAVWWKLPHVVGEPCLHTNIFPEIADSVCITLEP